MPANVFIDPSKFFPRKVSRKNPGRALVPCYINSDTRHFFSAAPVRARDFRDFLRSFLFEPVKLALLYFLAPSVSSAVNIMQINCLKNLGRLSRVSGLKKIRITIAETGNCLKIPNAARIQTAQIRRKFNFKRRNFSRPSYKSDIVQII